MSAKMSLTASNGNALPIKFDGLAFLDVNGAGVVHVRMNKDKRIVWVNVDGVCVFRSQAHEVLHLEGVLDDVTSK